MKYEAVFGDYKFSSPACEVAMQSSFGEIIEMRFTKPLVIPEGWGVIAMRRVIPAPKRWTVEEKKAGRLPEVGCSVLFTHNNFKCEVIAIDDSVTEDVELALRFSDGSILVCKINKIKPIETPEEKAQRLRSEWINKAYVDFHRFGCEIEVLQKEQLKQVYDALLSGELPMPSKKGGE